MSLKGLLYIGLFGLCAVGALFLPQLGIYGYIADYCINPSGQWWGAPFSAMGLRGSFTLAAATLLGMVLHFNRLKYGEKFLSTQERWLLVFLAVIWVLFFISPETVGRYTTTDHPSVKMTKIFVFVLMMSHVLTDIRKLNGLFWVLSSASLFLGVKAWGTPYGRFVRGRLEGIGGPDFDEANFFAAFMAAMLPIIAIQFLRSRNWALKIYALVCGAFTANAVILCRSRGAFLGLVAGAFASVWFAPQRLRNKVLILLLVGVLGGVYLTDRTFIERIMTITTDQGTMDESSSSRIELWKAGAKMFLRSPVGIGPGNWYQTIGRYIPEYEGKDSHNTFVKCAVELGAAGIFLFLLLIFLSYRNLRRIERDLAADHSEEANDFRQYFFAMVVSMAILLTCALTITMIYTEILWVVLMLPLCLRRAHDNAVLERRGLETA